MRTLLLYKTVVIYPRPPPSTSGATGGTISTASVSQITDYDVTRELDNLFAHLFSAFDTFAQVVNLVYLRPPTRLSTGKVSLYRMWGAMRRNFPSDALTRYMTSLLAKQWYKDMRNFRKVTTHRHEIEFRIDRPSVFMPTSHETKIILPDNPFSYPPTHSQHREFGVFGVNIFSETSTALDDMYGLMEVRIRRAGCIPI